MKHIGWCLDHMQIAMAKMPRDLNTNEKKKIAEDVIFAIKKYNSTLVEIIQNPKFEETVKRLEGVPFDGFRLQAKHIDTLITDLRHVAQVIGLTLEELTGLRIEPYNDESAKKWYQAYDKIVMLIDEKFGGDMGELRKEFTIALHSEEELRKIVTYEKHITELLQ